MVLAEEIERQIEIYNQHQLAALVKKTIDPGCQIIFKLKYNYYSHEMYAYLCFSPGLYESGFYNFSVEEGFTKSIQASTKYYENKGIYL